MTEQRGEIDHIDADARRLCAAHQEASPTRQPCAACTQTATEYDAKVRVGFRYRDGEVLTPEREALSRDEELPEVVLDLGDGEWQTLAELRLSPASTGGVNGA
ncbi:hypothetical protein QWY28_17215 [Nocardioides sp. SOB77]|uniref:Uncharacterized protein n=1 Tax=Nocardioides oceani TaxID=3058369 RepID=A0ABT8FJC9_9ACTN|nr:hypothetical protein [Nocardioides oceani]MDN4174704.1 hypothetical protein [Nocardioides oceani]